MQSAPLSGTATRFMITLTENAALQSAPLSGTATHRDRKVQVCAFGCNPLPSWGLQPLMIWATSSAVLDAIYSSHGDIHYKQKLLTVKKDSEEFFYFINLRFFVSAIFFCPYIKPSMWCSDSAPHRRFTQSLE